MVQYNLEAELLLQGSGADLQVDCENVWINERRSEQYFQVAFQYPAVLVQEFAVVQSCLWYLRTGESGELLSRLKSVNLPNSSQLRQLLASLEKVRETAAALRAKVARSLRSLSVSVVAEICDRSLVNFSDQLCALEKSLYSQKLKSLLQLRYSLLPVGRELEFLNRVFTEGPSTYKRHLENLIHVVEAEETAMLLSKEFLRDTVLAIHAPLLREIQLYVRGCMSETASNLPDYVTDDVTASIETLHLTARQDAPALSRIDLESDTLYRTLKSQLDTADCSFLLLEQRLNGALQLFVREKVTSLQPLLEAKCRVTQRQACKALREVLAGSELEPSFKDFVGPASLAQCKSDYNRVKAWCARFIAAASKLKTGFLHCSRTFSSNGPGVLDFSGIARQACQQLLLSISNYTRSVFLLCEQRMNAQFSKPLNNHSFVNIFPETVSRVAELLFLGTHTTETRELESVLEAFLQVVNALSDSQLTDKALSRYEYDEILRAVEKAQSELYSASKSLFGDSLCYLYFRKVHEVTAADGLPPVA